MGSFSYAAYSTAKAVMVALFYVLFFGLGFDFRQNPRILAVIAIYAERENHCIVMMVQDEYFYIGYPGCRELEVCGLSE